MRYRPDVDGLRAVAIVPVVLYHFGIPGFTGGFVGVDVFFVISGFLITTLIHDELNRNAFSLLHFYERRIRRIFPALFFLLLVVSVLAYAELFPTAFSMFGESVAATGLFSSNLEFWQEAGYFDAAADQKPLLHTWSLAVEEQFYLFFPPLMMLIARYAKGRYAAILAIAFAASFALSVWAVWSKPQAAFYLLPCRAWELAVGALIAVGAFRFNLGRTGANVLAAFGIVMIGYAVVAYTSFTPFPGTAALLPCLGAGFIIYAGLHNRSMINSVLSVRPIVFIGKISYSLYLWHWPVYVLGKYYVGRELFWTEAAALIAASVAIAIFSWRYIEQPFRRPGGLVSRRTLFLQAGTAMSLSVVWGLIILLSDGMPQRFAPDIQSILASEKEIRPCNGEIIVSENTACKIGKSPGGPSFILWGDSHARAIFPGLVEAAERKGSFGLAIAREGCPPLFGAVRVRRVESNCRAHNDMVRTFLEEHSTVTVILVARWAPVASGTPYGNEKGTQGFLQDDESREASPEENHRVFARSFGRTIEYLHDSGHRVVVVGPVPEIGWQVPETMARHRMRRLPIDFGPTLEQFQTRNAFVFSQFAKQSDFVETIYPHSVLCPGARCAVEHEGKPLYIDDDHLSRFGAEEISKIFDPILDKQ